MGGRKVIGMNTYIDRKDLKEENANNNWREKRKEKEITEINVNDLTWEIPDELMDRLNQTLKFNRYVDTETLIREYKEAKARK